MVSELVKVFGILASLVVETFEAMLPDNLKKAVGSIYDYIIGT